MNTGRKRVNNGSTSRLFIISGIGTGGHYFPAIVIARELVGRGKNVLFLVRHGFPEESAAHRYGLETLSIPAQGFYGTSMMQKLIALISYVRAAYRLYGIVKRTTAIAFGGFGALPLVAVCVLRRCDFYLFEPNRAPGRATRFLAPRAKMVFLGMPPIKVVGGMTIVTGIPLRHEFTSHRSVRIRRSHKKTILFFGGSGGAQRLNELALELQHILPAQYMLVIISGHRDYEWVMKRKTKRTRVIPFSHAPWLELKRADVVISRSGALTGYEIVSSNVPAVFIPYPYAVDDHQWFNAQYFVSQGGGMVMRQEDITASRLAEAIRKLSARKRQRIRVVNDAEKRIADVITAEVT
ncbi:MAG: UDP-N-acetylglucosamine--N-acetylmuramyl-(pentapeptide) pyrophosphoryl-undecaprenol N-acetylglucosamine transferase [candidate division WOR-3 bacterium]|nr:MAG: UDP-N-acetylglucosamine--N-acetylmuramyl-(pentapeptide) pyrophosphoryl-undecaprenol N-acetylglucosamine transferase [candidate division WOR-3 bacterium]